MNEVGNVHMVDSENLEDNVLVTDGNVFGDGSNQFNAPIDLSFMSKNNLYVVDWENHSIQFNDRELRKKIKIIFFNEEKNNCKWNFLCLINKKTQINLVDVKRKTKIRFFSLYYRLKFSINWKIKVFFVCICKNLNFSYILRVEIQKKRILFVKNSIFLKS